MAASAPPANFVPALVVVDLQEDFCPPNGSLAVPSGRDVIPPINSLLALPFAFKVATKDWHPLTHISFAANHPAPRNIPFVSTAQMRHPTDASRPPLEVLLWPVHCVQNSPGAELVPELNTQLLDEVVEKGVDERVEMFSGFTDPWHVGAELDCDSTSVCTSRLPKLLKARGVTDVFVVGLAMDYCVKATAEDAVRFGFRSWVVREGTRAVGGQQAGENMEEEMVERGVGVVGLEGKEVGWVRGLGE